jgi:hypothetical protein
MYSATITYNGVIVHRKPILTTRFSNENVTRIEEDGTITTKRRKAAHNIGFAQVGINEPNTCCSSAISQPAQSRNALAATIPRQFHSISYPLTDK